MEAVAHRHDFVAPPVPSAPLARELDRRFVALGARVAEKHLAAQTRNLDELFRKFHLRFVREEVRAVPQPGRLLLHRLHYAFRAVAHVVHADTAREIVILRILGRVHARALGFGNDDGRRIRRHQVLGVIFEQFSAFHSVISVPTPSRVNISNNSECGIRPSTR